MDRNIKLSGLDIFISEKTSDEFENFLNKNVRDLPSRNLRLFRKELFASVVSAIYNRSDTVKFCLDKNETKTRETEILELNLFADFTLAWES